MERIAILCVALAALVVNPTFAASSASVSMGPLAIGLIDLDTGDGVTPSITFHSSGKGAENLISAFARQDSVGIDSHEFRGATPWAPSSISAEIGGARATASINGPGDARGTTLAVSGSADDFESRDPNQRTLFSAYAFVPYTEGWSCYPAYCRFTLSANTAVTFVSAASVAVEGTGALIPGIFDGDHAEARAHMWLYWTDAYGRQVDSDGLDLAGYSDVDGGFSLSASRSLAVSFANATNGNLNGDISLEPYVFGFTSATVPEPSTFALLLAGMALLGFAARRRKGAFA